MPASWISAGASLLGGLMGSSSAKKAAQIQANAQIEAARMAAEEARFRPVGVTTRFGQSQFQTDANGRVSGAGYTLDPAFRAYQDRFMGLAGGGLSQAEMAQQQFAPLGQAAQGLFGLGQQYLAESPEQAAQKYMAGQQNLLAPSRERQFAQLQNQLFQTGRGGLAVGATGARPGGGAGLGAASPEMEAYYNAVAQQDAGLAAQAMQAGQQQTAFGAGLFGTGGNLLTQGYQGQTTALGPYEAYLAQMRQLEALGQDPLNIGINIGAKGQSAAGAQALYGGGMSAAQTTAANAYNPYGQLLMQAGQNPQFKSGLEKLFSGSGPSGYIDPIAYGSNYG
tara:strand:+ start:78 stop:1088 length:1011 start_codon:yes stop_codon:yes gene_type:complete